jgi:hypothetical protein
MLELILINLTKSKEGRYMPCYDSRNTYSNGRSEGEAAGFEKGKQFAARHINQLEAALCAILNELERRDICENVVAEASRNGLIDLMGFWVNHKKSDRARLANDIHKYSKDEQAVIRELLD